MNKTFKYAISVVLGAAMVTPAFAQRDNFPDVKDTHWAYEAVNRLKKEGIIVGYPDGTFGGKRMITRYEMATLIYAIYSNMKNVTEGLDAQIKALEAKVNEMGGKEAPSNGGDVAALRDAIKSLRSDVNGMKAWGDDITMLKKMADSYQKELSSLGVDVEAMKKDISDLSARVKKLEDAKPNVAISGDMNFFVAAGSKGSQGNAPINQDGRFAGASGTGVGAGLDTLTVLHELGLKFQTTNETGTKGVATLVVGNAVGPGAGFGDQASVASAVGTAYGVGNTNVYLHEMYASLNDSLVGLGFSAKVGRQGLKISPYVLQRIDNTSFFENERYDNGEYALDGVNASIGFGGKSSLNVFLGQTSNQQTTNGGIVQPLTVAGEYGNAAILLSAARTMGANLNFKLGENGGLNVSFVDFDSNTVNGAGANRLEVYGADLGYTLGGNLTLSAGAGKSTYKNGNTSIADNDNERVNAGLAYNSGALSLSGNYSKVEANYVAPGDWGRVGIFRNLNNVETISGKVNFKLNDTISLNGMYMTAEQVIGGGEIDGYRAGIDYKLNGNWNLMASYEDTKFKSGYTINGFTNPEFKFTTVGFGYDMGANTLFKLWYQYSETNNFTTAINGVNPNGGFIGAQLSVKF